MEPLTCRAGFRRCTRVLDNRLGFVDLTEWASAQCIHVTTAHGWWREGALLVLALKVGWMVLESADMVAVPTQEGAASAGGTG